MNQKVRIRKAVREDFEEIHTLVLQVHEMHLTQREDLYKKIDPLEKNIFIEELQKEDSIYLVAELREKIIGICFAKIKNTVDHAIMKDRKIIYIEDICVDQTKRRNGIGKKLYQEILKIGEEIKADSVELMVWGFNENAMDFYKSLNMNVKNLKFEQKIKGNN